MYYSVAYRRWCDEDCKGCENYGGMCRQVRVTENVARINDIRAPRYLCGRCEMENTQFCPFSEDGHHHGVICPSLEQGCCPYVRM